jgi:hypothetical protein
MHATIIIIIGALHTNEHSMFQSAAATVIRPCEITAKLPGNQVFLANCAASATSDVSSRHSWTGSWGVTHAELATMANR